MLLGADIPRASLLSKRLPRGVGEGDPRRLGDIIALAANLGFIVLHMLQTLVGLARRVSTRPSGDRS